MDHITNLAMSFASFNVGGIVAMILGLAVLIIVHEFGHWLAAQALGFKTPIFSIGFGKPYFVLGHFRNTEFRISPWLLGGYVAIPELGDESSAKDWMKANGIETQGYVYTRKAIWRRAIVAVAGVFMNVVLAVVLLFGLFAIKGVPTQVAVPNSVVIYNVEASPDVTIARDAGLRGGDKVVTIGGAPVKTVEDLRDGLAAHKSAPVIVVVERNGTSVTVTLTPTAEGKVGVSMGPEVKNTFTPVSVGEAAKLSFTGTWNGLTGIAKGLGMMVGIVEKPQNLPDGATDVHAIVGIVSYGADMFEQGVAPFVMFLVMISLNLAVFNLLPIPILDGGHLVFLALEKVRGKPLSPQVQGMLYQVFFMLFMALLAWGLWNDFTKPLGQ